MTRKNILIHVLKTKTEEENDTTILIEEWIEIGDHADPACELYEDIISMR